jgi:hypothetical protein
VVVLLAVVCVAGPVFITQASIVPNYRQAYDNEWAKNRIFSSQIRVAEQVAAAATYDREKVKDLQAQIVERAGQAKIDDGQALAAKLEEVRTLTAATADLKIKLDNEIANAKLALEQSNASQARLEGARAANEKLTKEYAKTEDLLKQSQSQLARRESQKKFDDEQIQELKDQNKDLLARVAAGGAAAKPGETAVVPEADAVISGTVTAVKDDMASINVGSAKGVKTGMKFTIYRGAQYVGVFQVQGEVGLDSAAGVIVLKRLDAAMGDKVTTKLTN